MTSQSHFLVQIPFRTNVSTFPKIFHKHTQKKTKKSVCPPKDKQHNNARKPRRTYQSSMNIKEKIKRMGRRNTYPMENSNSSEDHHHHDEDEDDYLTKNTNSKNNDNMRESSESQNNERSNDVTARRSMRTILILLLLTSAGAGALTFVVSNNNEEGSFNLQVRK